jgi:molybdopterin molybdotransferase
MLAALVRRAGGLVVSTAWVPDAPDLLRGALEAAAACADIIVTAGGASVGDHDLVKPALLAAGGSLDFWRIDMKPGKPFLHGQLSGIPLYGLPGNPVSAFVTAVLFVLPVLRRLQGSPLSAPPTKPALWATDVDNPDRRPHYIRIVAESDGRIRPSGAQGSHRLASLAAADGLAEIPGKTRAAAGSPARVITW